MEKKENPNPNHHSSPPNDDEYQNLLNKLEQDTNWDGRRLVKNDGFWCPLTIFRPLLSTQKHFKAQNGDVILASVPKSGATWLKTLAFSISNRYVYNINTTPLLTANPHTVVPFLEFNLYLHHENPDLQHLPSPRVFSTHIPFHALPESIRRESGCKIIYIKRNPLDQFISDRHFLLENKIERDAVTLGVDEAFDMFCQGIHPFVPVWDHILGYWNAHVEKPEEVLFLEYEDLKADVILEMKNIGGVMKSSSFFRKGEVGDWSNYLTPAMAQRVEKIMASKFEGSGLVLKS